MAIKTPSEIDPNEVYDVCIVGSGPAGIVLANELADSQRKICVMESGIEKKSTYHDTLHSVLNGGEIEVSASSRARVLGGTSTLWRGISAPLDPIDIRSWPLTYDELKSYYSLCTQYGFPAFRSFNTKSYVFQSDVLDEKRFIIDKTPWNFGKRFEMIFDNENVDLYKDATVIHITSQNDIEGKKFIKNIKVRDQEGIEYTLYAKTFVLAGGTIENCRLLLVNNIGNEHDQVGRYFMDHPKNAFGTIALNKGLKGGRYLYGYSDKDWNYYSGIRVKEEVQKKKNILNSYIKLEPVYPKSRFLRFFSKKLFRPREVKVWNFLEMEPRAENRIVLSDKVDSNGISFPKVILNLSKKDHDSIIELHKIVARELEKKNIGNLNTSGQWPEFRDASHHIGGTRMGVDPKTSVVDKDLKVHSVSNLYIAGSSVFPTSGCANPTYTLCALSIRLAETLKNLE